MFSITLCRPRLAIVVDDIVAKGRLKRLTATACHVLEVLARGIVLASILSACARSTNPSVVQVATPARTEQSDWDKAWSLLAKQDRPLPAIALMEKMVENKQLPAQTLAQFYAITGDERGTDALMDQGARPDVSPPADMAGYVPQPAVDAIVMAARGRRVVILNENHSSQRQRAFAFEVAMRLRKEGFTHFGAETFTRELAESMKDGAPDLTTGVYTLDPIFADLVRQAAAVGYQLFDYEQRIDQRPSKGADRNVQTTAREQAQAENIKNWLDTNPSARVFIYVGGGHGSKIPDRNDVAWMALRLQRMTGIDPLTINQNFGTPRGRAEFDGSLYRGAANIGVLQFPAALINATGQWLTHPGYDLVIFLPRLADIEGRPGWLGMNGYRKNHALNLAPIPTRSLVRAFVKGEPAGSIAMDQILVAANQTEATLMLPVGEYHVWRQFANGESTQLASVVVPRSFLQ